MAHRRPRATKRSAAIPMRPEGSGGAAPSASLPLLFTDSGLSSILGEAAELFRLEKAADVMGATYSIVLYGYDKAKMEATVNAAFDEVQRPADLHEFIFSALIRVTNVTILSWLERIS
jgi:hypothetical protein